MKSGLAALGGTPWWHTLSQYGVNKLSIGGSWGDTTAYPHAGTSDDPLRTTDYRAAVKRALAANGWSAGLDRIYLVITANNTEACGLDRLVGSGFAVYAAAQSCTFPTSVRNTCGGHSFFSTGNRQLLYAILPLSNDRGCKPEPSQSPNHDLRVDEAVTVGTALLAETAVDPLGTGWYVRPAPVGLLCNIPNPFPLHLGARRYALFGLYSNAQHTCVHGFPPLRMSASLSAPRVRARERETLRVTTARGAHISVGFDRGTDVRSSAGTADARGHFTYAWVAGPHPRRGYVTVTAVLEGRYRSATVRFQIVK